MSYIPCLTFNENSYASSSDDCNFYRDVLLASSKLDERSFDKAIYLLAIFINGISALKTQSAYDSFINYKVGIGEKSNSGMRCESCCLTTILALWRVLGFPYPEIWGDFPYNKLFANQIMDKIAIKNRVFRNFNEFDGNTIFSIGNVVAVKFGNNNTHYFTVSSYPLRVVDNSKPSGYKYLFVGINGGLSHSYPKCPKHGYQIIRTLKFEAWFNGAKWIVKNYAKATWQRELQFYYNTKEILLTFGDNKKESRMPLGIGGFFLPVVDTWGIVPNPPIGHEFNDNYFIQIDADSINQYAQSNIPWTW